MKTLLKLVMFTAICGFFIISCKKQRPTPPPATWGKAAVLVKWDFTMCPTCGGFFLNFGNNISMNDSTYHVRNWNASIAAFVKSYGYMVPHFVQVYWQKDTLPVFPNSIIVTKIGLR